MDRDFYKKALSEMIPEEILQVLHPYTLYDMVGSDFGG